MSFWDLELKNLEKISQTKSEEYFDPEVFYYFWLYTKVLPLFGRRKRLEKNSARRAGRNHLVLE